MCVDCSSLTAPCPKAGFRSANCSRDEICYETPSKCGPWLNLGLNYCMVDTNICSSHLDCNTEENEECRAQSWCLQTCGNGHGYTCNECPSYCVTTVVASSE